MREDYFNFGYARDELKSRYATGKEKLKTDEYLGADGLPYCKNCNTIRVLTLDEKTVRYGNCKCLREKAEKEQREEEARRRAEEFEQKKKYSSTGDKYRNLMFSDAIITDQNAKVYQKAKIYVEESKKVIENNIGLYVYGENSTGKTFLLSCICNELLWKGYTCFYTNLFAVLNEIRSSYDKEGMGECKLLKRFQEFDFVFFDDVGKEFLAREYNSASSKWEEKKFFEIINTRYNAQKPTVFSSNYSIDELSRVLNLDNAIVARIDEMATRTIRLDGEDFRKIVRLKKSDIAKSLGI